MAYVKYTKTYFQEPNLISQQLYENLKIELRRNPNKSIDPNPETFIGHFSATFILMGVCAFLILITIIIYPDLEMEGIFPTIFFLSFFLIIIAIFSLFLGGPSYATYLKSKNDYYNRLKNSILNSSSYGEFLLFV